MCTLTIYASGGHRIVTMNRDEQRQRHELELLHDVQEDDGTRVVYPVDGASHGTWMGVNNHGLVMCLLNRYQNEAGYTDARQSRGHIIPECLKQGSFRKAAEHLEKLDPSGCNPFDLFVMGPGDNRHFQWTGEDYANEEFTVAPWYMFTSSSLPDAIEFRWKQFKAWRSEIGERATDAEEILRGFHLIQVEKRKHHSVLMERENAHTKSVVQADIQGGKLELRYFPDILERLHENPLSLTLTLNKYPKHLLKRICSLFPPVPS